MLTAMTEEPDYQILIWGVNYQPWSEMENATDDFVRVLEKLRTSPNKKWSIFSGDTQMSCTPFVILLQAQYKTKARPLLLMVSCMNNKIAPRDIVAR